MPTSGIDPFDIHHDPVGRRFTTVVDGVEAEVDYHYDADVLVIHHTGVPRPVEGRGIASALVRAVFEFARGTGKKVRPACSYAATWVQRHAQYADLLA
ncbi:GNAT family N-acetyltransferase [Lysobacter fragariae]